MLGIGHASAPVIAAVAAFHETFRFMAPQTVIVLGVGHAATPIVATMAAFH
jgi:hypothetical protein